MSSSVSNAKTQLAQVIKKARIHLYKPIQVAEILYRHRIGEGIDLGDPTTYRTQSRQWRDSVTTAIYNAHSTSSAGYQDDLFNKQLPPPLMEDLGAANQDGSVEKYIYEAVKDRLSEVHQILPTLSVASGGNPNLSGLVATFADSPGLSRSVDKVFEIVTYTVVSLFLTHYQIRMRSTIGVPVLKQNFSSSQFISALHGDSDQLDQDAMVFRMGVANAADAGIDMWSNFGPGFQTKHIELTSNELKEISEKFTGQRLVVVVRSVSSEVDDQLVNKAIAIGSKLICVLTLADLQNLLDELIAIDSSREPEFRRIVSAEVAIEFGGNEGLENLEELGRTRSYW
jgi:hypothetical protein